MILGVGNDLVDIRRIRRALDRNGDRFRARLFTPAELRVAATRYDEAAALARLYAVKEAVAKALGTGIAQGVAWRQIELLRGEQGKPFLRLHGAARRRAWSLTPAGFVPDADVSASDEPPYASAVAVLFARAPGLGSRRMADIPQG